MLTQRTRPRPTRSARSRSPHENSSTPHHMTRGSARAGTRRPRRSGREQITCRQLVRSARAWYASASRNPPRQPQCQTTPRKPVKGVSAGEASSWKTTRPPPARAAGEREPSPRAATMAAATSIVQRFKANLRRFHARASPMPASAKARLCGRPCQPPQRRTKTNQDSLCLVVTVEAYRKHPNFH